MNILMASVMLTPAFASARLACALSFGSIRAFMYAVLPITAFLPRTEPTTTNAALFPAGKNAASHCAIVAAGSTAGKSGPPEQGIPGRAYQIDAGWMGGLSIDRF